MCACTDMHVYVQTDMRYLQVYFERNMLGSEGVAVMCKVCVCMYICMYVCSMYVVCM